MIAFGEHALRFALPDGTSRAALFEALRAVPGVTDVVLAESVGMVVGGARTPIEEALRGAARGLEPVGRTHTVDVVYDGADLDEIATATGLGRDGVVRAHTDRDHVVAMLGFLPGFAYLRGVAPELAVPRRASPRTRVPARSVAIAAGYTGIYPSPSPGGWHLLGRAPSFTAFDAERATFAIGDRVRFRAVDDAPAAPEPSVVVPARTVDGPRLVVTRVAGPALLVDGGRPGHMHEGVPPGGPLVPEALARANASLGNAAGACGIEVFGSLELTAAGGALAVADDRGGARKLRDGERITVTTEGKVRARYLAAPGGLDVPIVLGGRGTLLVAGLGGLEGRALRRGDVLAPTTARPSARNPASHESDRADRAIPITPGPDAVPGVSVDALCQSAFRIAAASDRTGTRLEGPPLGTSHDPLPSAPMVRGAIELTPRGLIVLGPDHPTTGGYPVVALVRHDAIGRLFARPVGAEVRFMVSTSSG